MFINSTPSKENLEQNKATVESIWNTWSETIADARELSKEDLDAMLNNLELCFPEDFLEKGLVDGLTTRQEMRDKLALLSNVSSADDIKAISIYDYALATEPLEPIGAQPKVAVVFLDGEIVDGDQIEQIAGDRFAKILADIRKDPAVKATVLRINSPGGSVLAAEKILAEVELLQEKMPVVASYGNYAASGGYWISAGCDKIYTNATTLTGSIGVFSMIPDFQKTVEKKLHVGMVSVNSNKHADMYGMMRPLDGAEVKYMQKSVEKIYERFIGIVADGRGMQVAQVDRLAQGRIWTGSEAVMLNLADEIGTLEDAIDWAIASIEYSSDASQIEIASYPKPMTSLEALITQMQGGQQNILSGTPFEAIGQAFGKWSISESGKAYARMPYQYVIR
jgi:protease-4